jgi:hypothetical protein
VQPPSEYPPKFADVETVPPEVRGIFVLRAAYVVSVKATPIIANATIAVIIESLGFFVLFPHSNQIPCSKS